MKEGEIMDRRPIEYCYWVEEGQLLAGEYPRDKDDEAASRAKLAALTKAGVNTFIDLTQAGELSPYAQWLDSDRQTYYRFPIWDVRYSGHAGNDHNYPRHHRHPHHQRRCRLPALLGRGWAHGDHRWLLAGQARASWTCGIEAPCKTLGSMPQVRLALLTGD